ncbi:sortase-associated OmpA-like protein PdsO [Shewanella surugensis]|uniref:Sortase-associated OmpA-like protein PdsO n=1 Tax=Shewanella surugensis TaxID=212020 RepID=A0ABT0LFA2_9GAMM|nr:sortase-associated OmpA-like protein PdsO [Shewanella surugensis]MCL1126012.1 sortase-associated OmpA-like protein PdsO [Shewanella surugensis]
MKKNIITLFLAGVVNLSQVSMSAAEGVQTEQMTQTNAGQDGTWIGLGSGVLVGAVVGGPLGALVGAFTGGLIGKSVDQGTELEANQVRRDQEQGELQRLTQLQTTFLAKEAEYERVNEILTALSFGLNIQFRTGSSEIEDHFKEQLQHVAYVMSLTPQLIITLTGYADRRGNNDFNQALSEQRVAEVMQYLKREGVDENRLVASAFGARFPLTAEQSMENNFFDRRVTLSLQSEPTQVLSD